METENRSMTSRYLWERGLLDRLHEVVSHHSQAVVISDQNLAHHYRSRFACEWLVIPAGEKSKTLATASQLYGRLTRLGVDRKSAILAFGGGVVGDLGGFVAATFLRGLPFYQVPTSLLAMVDSSIGGKVGVDLPEGKNLVGAFYPAEAILVDPNVLKTLPASEWSNGMAEVIKHALLDGEEHLARLEQLDTAQPGLEFIYPNAQVKMEVVARDPKEQGERAHLNLGHTLGHAFEQVSGYQLSHGQAVAIGLVGAVRLSRRVGLLEVDFEERLEKLLTRWGLPTCLDQDLGWPEVLEALRRDKKNLRGQLTFVLPQRVGRVSKVEGVEVSSVEEVYHQLCP